MALGPIDYSGMQQYNDLIGNIQSGAQFGLGLQQVAEQRRQQEQARMAQQQYQSDVAAYLQNPTAEGAASLVTKYPQQREAILGGWKALDENRQRDELQVTNQVYSALSSDRPDIAQKVLEDRIAARQNSGLPVAKEQGALDLVKTNPAQAKGYLGLVLAQLDENFAKNFATLGAEGRAQDKAPTELRKARAEADKAVVDATYAEPKARADLQNTLSQVSERAGRLALDQDKLSSEVGLRLQEFNQKVGQLPDDARKLVNDATAGAVAAEQSAGQLLGLASKLEALGGGNGGFSSAWEWLKKSGGWQSDVSAARQEYVRLRNSQAIKSLPPGPATDKDIELAMKGFPPETADSAYLASFLRGQAKLQQLEAAAETARADWIGQVGSLTRPRKDINVDGVQVSAGTSFPDFLRGYAKRKSESIGKEAATSTRSYLRFANPSQDDGVR